MALPSTIYRVSLDVSDLDRHHYATYPLTVARHPSETETRLMLRLLAFALFADQDLALGRGISTDDEPDLWQRDPGGRIQHWIDLGLPDVRRLRKACGRADRVTLVAYGERSFGPWWSKNAAEFERLATLGVLLISDADAAAIAGLATRNLDLQCTLQEGTVWIGSDSQTVSLSPTWIRSPSDAI